MSHRFATGKRRDKARDVKAHAAGRLGQRYGLDGKAAEAIAALLASGAPPATCTFVEKQSLRLSVWDVEYDGQIVRVVYDKTRKLVVTALPREANGG